MSKFIAYSPNGQAYQCDTLAEAKMVQGGGKRRNPNAKGEEWLWERFERFKGPEAGVEQAKSSLASAIIGREFGESVEGYLARSPSVKERYDAATAYLKGKGAIRNPKRKRRNPIPNYIPTRNPVYSASEDYNMGLFAGAIEHGNLPDPKASAEYRKGYAQGATVARVNPQAVQQALGVFKATGSQAKAGHALRDAALDTGRAVANPKRKRRNPLPAYVTPDMSGDPRFVSVANPSWQDIKAGAAKFGKAAMKHAKAAAKGARSGYKAAREACAEQADVASAAGAADVGLRRGLKAGYAGYKAHLGKNPRKAKRNPMSAAARKHLAHEKGEEATFATMLDKLPVGVTLKAGKHRVRKLSKGYVVVDGVRMTDKEAAKKIHRG